MNDPIERQAAIDALRYAQHRFYVIIDEYDEIISFDDFVALVEKKQSENNPDDFTYSQNVNGYRFSDGEFC